MEIQTDNPESGYTFPCYSFDNVDCIVLNTAYIMTCEASSTLQYILGILNSHLGKFLVKLFVSQLQTRQFRMLAQFVSNFPIPLANEKFAIPIIHLVDTIIKGKKSDIDFDTLNLEAQIDALVYRLYGLTDKEIGFIESL